MAVVDNSSGTTFSLLHSSFCVNKGTSQKLCFSNHRNITGGDISTPFQHEIMHTATLCRINLHLLYKIEAHFMRADIKSFKGELFPMYTYNLNSALRGENSGWASRGRCASAARGGDAAAQLSITLFLAADQNPERLRSAAPSYFRCPGRS